QALIFLPVELEAQLQYARVEVLIGGQSREDGAEVRTVRVGVEGIIPAVVVLVDRIEGFDAEFRAHRFAEAHALQNGSVKRRYAVLAELPDARGRLACGRRLAGGVIRHPEPVVLREVRAAAGSHRVGHGGQAAVIVLADNAVAPAADLSLIPVDVLDE